MVLSTLWTYAYKIKSEKNLLEFYKKSKSCMLNLPLLDNGWFT